MREPLIAEEVDVGTPLMSPVLRRRVILALVGALALPAALPLGTATASHFSDTEELSAEDNVGAAIAYSVSTFPEGAEEAVLGRDDAFADSLASGMLQDTRPLLLTSSAALSDLTKAELARLEAKTVHVLGGEQAITPAVVSALEAEGYTVQRHSGPTRIDTAVEVAKKLAPAATKAIIARAFGTAEDETRAFADSLAAGGWAASAAMPVLLTETEKLSEATAAYLKTSAIKEVFVVGGQSAVSQTAVTQLTALGVTVKRVSGPTRFHTALAIASERGFTTAGDADKVIVTEGQAPDAWAAGFAAAGRAKKDNAPIVLAVGTEIPEPTMRFLTGQAPSEEPTEEPEPAGIAALLCAPMLATEACDAAATALGQVAGAGPQLVTFEVPAVARFDHAVGKLAEPKSVNALTVTGCGYTNEPIYFEPADGTFYLMLAGDPGTCSAEFTLEKSAGTQKQTVEFNVGEDFTPASSMIIPELVAVRPVKADEEGIHLRFVFDEPIAPSPKIDPMKFHIFDYKGKPDTGASASKPSLVTRDPRNPRAVIATFSSLQFEDSTVASVEGGLVCDSQPTAPATTTICDTNPLSTAVSGDRVKPGAVRDLDRYPNPTGHFGIRTLDRTGSASQAPDLVSVGDYQAGDRSLLFTFSEDVEIPTATATVGAATVLLKSGTIKSSDANGWRRGPTNASLRVAFAGDGLAAADTEQIRRAFVRAGTVSSTDTSGIRGNTPVTAIVAGGGISDLPDFVNIESPQYTVPRKITFVFEEELDFADDNTTAGPGDTTPAKFAAVLPSGAVVYSNTNGTLTKPTLQAANRRKVDVPFDETLTETPIHVVVLTGAVRSFGQRANFSDSIKLTNPLIYGPGVTAAPDLTKVQMIEREPTCDTAAAGKKGYFELNLQFDRDIGLDESGTGPAIQVWYLKVATQPESIRVARVTTVVGGTGGADMAGEQQFRVNGKKAESTHGGGDQSGACTTTAMPALPAGWDNAKYLAVEAAKVRHSSDSALVNYPGGLPIPN